MSTIKLDALIIDPSVDIRSAQDFDAIARYAETVEHLPPVTVFATPEGLLLAGGFHRVEAARRADRNEIEAEVREGTREDAMAFAALDNATHGVPLTKEERNTAIRRLKSLGWKQDAIASRFGLSKSRVSHILRDELRNATSEDEVVKVLSEQEYEAKVEDGRRLIQGLDEARWKMAEVTAAIDAEAWNEARVELESVEGQDKTYRATIHQLFDMASEFVEVPIGDNTIGTWWGWVQTWERFGDPETRHPDLDFEGHYELARRDA
ncbi:MAG: ParB/RepB/Spo0J family partition protein [Actinomycetota bacterium]